MSDGGKEVVGGGGKYAERDFFLLYLDHRNEPYHRDSIKRKRNLDFKSRK